MALVRTITRSAGVLALGAGLAAASLAPASAQAAGTQILVLQGDSLVRIAPDAPGTALATVPVSGLGAGDELLGIDVRPANGQVYAVGSSGVVYTIDPTSGAATAGPTLSEAPDGTAFGVDFNPAADRLRIVSDTGQSLRANVDDGVTVVDGSIAYGADDAGAGTTPAVVAVAYTNPDTDPDTGTELFDLESERDVLALQSPPNDGGLVTRGALGADADDDSAFDIAADGTAMAIIDGTLVRVDLAAGTTTAVGPVAGGNAQGMAFVAAAAAPAPGTTSTSRVAELPRTGAGTSSTGVVGAALLAAGAACLAVTARRRPQRA